MNDSNLISSMQIGPNEYPVSVSFMELTPYQRNSRWHWHEEMEVLIVNSGSVQVQIENEAFPLNAGQGLILNQNVMHRIITTAEKGSNTCYCVNFHPSYVFGKDQPTLNSRYITPIQRSASFRALVLDENIDDWNERIMEEVNELIAVNVAKKSDFELITRGHLCFFWALLLKKVKDNAYAPSIPTTTGPSSDDLRIRSAIEYIEDHYFENVTLDEIADYIHISKSECCRCFKRSLNMTPFEYLMKYRIHSATRKLIESPGGESISNLAMSVGFNNASYFNKVFRKFMNCTPREYKAMVAKANATGVGNAGFEPYKF